MKEGGFSPRSLQYRQKASTVPADSVCARRHSRDMLANPFCVGGTQGSQGEAGTLSLRLPKAPSLLHYNGLFVKEMQWKLLRAHWNLNKTECLVKTSVNI